MTGTEQPTSLDRALIEEATKKSALIWVRGRRAVTRPLWHVWHQGAATLVGDGPGEQPLSDLELVSGGTATVTVRSKDNGGRLADWPARVVELEPHSPPWAAAVAELRGRRLNAPDAERMVERWAGGCRVLRLEPVPEPLPAPPGGSLASQPPATPASTRRAAPAALPKLSRRRRHGRR